MATAGQGLPYTRRASVFQTLVGFRAGKPKVRGGSGGRAPLGGGLSLAEFAQPSVENGVDRLVATS